LTWTLRAGDRRCCADRALPPPLPLLQHTPADPLAAAAAAARHNWRPSGGGAAPHEVWRQASTRRGALWFSAGCFLAGCGLFAGALASYNAFQYDHSSPSKAEERLRAPSEQRQRMVDLVLQGRDPGGRRP
jgi:hypothetical protein